MQNEVDIVSAIHIFIIKADRLVVSSIKPSRAPLHRHMYNTHFLSNEYLFSSYS